MDKYRRVSKPKHQDGQENEIFVTAAKKLGHHCQSAMYLMQEKNYDAVTFRAMGSAISNTIFIAETLKRRIPGLHQITTISSTHIIDIYEPLVEGLDRYETTRNVSSISILLSRSPLDTTAKGYQAPLPPSAKVEEIWRINRSSSRDRRYNSNQSSIARDQPNGVSSASDSTDKVVNPSAQTMDAFKPKDVRSFRGRRNPAQGSLSRNDRPIGSQQQNDQTDAHENVVPSDRALYDRKNDASEQSIGAERQNTGSRPPRVRNDSRSRTTGSGSNPRRGGKSAALTAIVKSE